MLTLYLGISCGEERGNNENGRRSRGEIQRSKEMTDPRDVDPDGLARRDKMRRIRRGAEGGGGGRRKTRNGRWSPFGH